MHQGHDCRGKLGRTGMHIRTSLTMGAHVHSATPGPGFTETTAALTAGAMPSKRCRYGPGTAACRLTARETQTWTHGDSPPRLPPRRTQTLRCTSATLLASVVGMCIGTRVCGRLGLSLSPRCDGLCVRLCMHARLGLSASCSRPPHARIQVTYTHSLAHTHIYNRVYNARARTSHVTRPFAPRGAPPKPRPLRALARIIMLSAHTRVCV